VLKPAEVLPRLLTGKLSDFAGMIVAPLLLVQVFRPSTKWGRALCFVAVGLPFAAINISADAAHAFERATAMTGMSWLILVDPTDLIAFAIVPYAWRLADGARVVSQAWLRVAVVAGAAASVASGRPFDWSTSVFVANRTDREVDLRVRWLDADVDCEAVRGELGRALSPAVFGEGVTINVLPDRTMPVDRAAYLERPADEGPRPCDAVLLQGDAMTDTIFFFEGLQIVSVPPTIPDPGAVDDGDQEFDGSGMIRMHMDGGRIRLSHSDALASTPLQARVPDSTCTVEARSRFQWSELPERLAEVTLQDVNVTGDGCLALTIDGFEHPRYLCIPARDFPFAPGDELSLTSESTSAGRTLTVTREASADWPRVELEVLSGFEEVPGASVVALDCEGRRLPCGAYAQPVALELDNGARLVSGTSIDLPASTPGESVRMVVGGATKLVVGAPECGPGLDAAGPSIDVVMIRKTEG